MGYLIRAETKTGIHEVHCGNHELAVKLLALWMHDAHERDHLEVLTRVADIFGAEVRVTTRDEDDAALERAAQIMMEEAAGETIQ